MSHYGPMDETQEITGWTARELAEWLTANPDWADATIKSCACEICGDVIELVRPAKWLILSSQTERRME